MAMQIVNGNSYDAELTENGTSIACCAFFCKEQLADEAEQMECNDSDLFLVVGLDTAKYRDYDSGYADFQEEYAREVATMVYQSLLKG